MRKSGAKKNSKTVSSHDVSPPWDDVTDAEFTDVKTTSRDIVPFEGDKIPSKRAGGRSTKKAADSGPIAEYDKLAATKFNKRMKRLAKRIGDLDTSYNSAAVREEATRQMLASVTRMIPLAEAKYNDSREDKASYAYTNLVNQQRELMADLAAMSTTEELAERVIAEVLRPAFEGMLSYVIAEISDVRKETLNATSPEALSRAVNTKLVAFLKGFATYSQEAQDGAITVTAKTLRT